MKTLYTWTACAALFSLGALQRHTLTVSAKRLKRVMLQWLQTPQRTQQLMRCVSLRTLRLFGMLILKWIA